MQAPRICGNSPNYPSLTTSHALHKTRSQPFAIHPIPGKCTQLKARLAATTSTDFVCICQLSSCIIHVELQWIANTKYRPNEVQSTCDRDVADEFSGFHTNTPNECNRICVPCNLQSTSTRFYCHRLQTSRNSADCERCDFSI